MRPRKQQRFVGTCPAWFWPKWLAEGDCAGDPPSGNPDGEAWFTRSSPARRIRIGDRFYVVARGRLRGYAVVSRVVFENGGWWIHRKRPVAVTIPERIRGFRGVREAWWPEADERPFPDWRTAE